MKKVIYLFIATVFLNCSNQKKKFPENFDFGKTKNGLYKNDYFNMEVLFNPNWIVQDKQEVNNLIERGSDLATGDNENLKSIIKASQINTAYLLAVFKHEVGAAVEYNPSFMLVAENTKNFPGIKNGKDYLFHAKKALLQSQMSYSFEKEVFEKEIGRSSFHVMEVKFDYMGKIIIQEYISTVIKGFSLSFIISYTTEEEKNELYEVINNIKI
ncbi:hypothetical protein [Tenacibaculum sp. 190524A02b]|uniref:Lipoprotein n=1 Tax=Tenacibaculum vairaonense TaxID=3137860 RepID=A0ABM9PL36_9FLAO